MGVMRDLVMGHARQIHALLPLHHACDIRVFGSVARGEDGPDSDVDFLVEFAPGASILDQVHLEADLRALLGEEVDVIPTGALKPRDAHILRDSQPL